MLNIWLNNENIDNTVLNPIVLSKHDIVLSHLATALSRLDSRRLVTA